MENILDRDIIENIQKADETVLKEALIKELQDRKQEADRQPWNIPISWIVLRVCLIRVLEKTGVKFPD